MKVVLRQLSTAFATLLLTTTAKAQTGFLHTFESPWQTGDSIDKPVGSPAAAEWQVRNGAAVIGTDAGIRASNPSGSSSAQVLKLVGGSQPSVEVLRIKNDISSDYAFLDFSVKPVAEPSSPQPLSSIHVNGVHFAFVEQTAEVQFCGDPAPVIRPTGYGIVLVEDFNQSNGGSQWRETPWVFSFEPGSRKAKDWMRITIFNDPPNSTGRVCDISINGSLIAARVTPAPLSPLISHSLFFGSESHADVLIDDFSASSTSPFGAADSDNDGLPDSWENLTGVTNTNGINGLIDEIFPGGMGPGGKTWAHILADQNFAAVATLAPPPLDTDGDKIPDYWEDQYVSSTTNPVGMNKYDASDAGRDFDRDGLTNLEEFKMGTTPLSQPVYEAGIVETDPAALTTTITAFRDYNVQKPAASTVWVGLQVQLYNGETVAKLVRMDYGKEPVVSTVWLGPSARNIAIKGIGSDGTVAGNCLVYSAGTGPVSSAFIWKPDGTARYFAGTDSGGQVIVSTNCVGLKDTGEAFGTITNADYTVNLCSFRLSGVIERISTTSMPTSGSPQFQVTGMTPDGWVYGTRNVSNAPYYTPWIMNFTVPLSSATVQLGASTGITKSGGVEGPWITGSYTNFWIKGPASEFNLPSPGTGRTYTDVLFAGGKRGTNPLLRLTRSYGDQGRYYSHIAAATDTASIGIEIPSLAGGGGVFAQGLNMSREAVGRAVNDLGNYVPFISKFGRTRAFSESAQAPAGLRLNDASIICGNGDVLGIGLWHGRTRLLRYTFMADTDGDGLSDQYEIDNHLRLYDASDRDLDADGDGASNLKEFLAGSDPGKRDTDGDTIPDGWEIDHDLDPCDPTDAALDFDDDHLTNRQEYLINSNPFTPLQATSDQVGVEADYISSGRINDSGQVLGQQLLSGQSSISGFRWNGTGTTLQTWSDYLPYKFTAEGLGGTVRPAGNYFSWPQVRSDAGTILRASPPTDGTNSFSYLDSSRAGDLLYSGYVSGVGSVLKIAAKFGSTETVFDAPKPPWAIGIPSVTKISAAADPNLSLPASFDRLLLGSAQRYANGVPRVDGFLARISSSTQATFETVSLPGGNTLVPAFVDSTGRVLASYDGYQGWCFIENGSVQNLEIGPGSVIDMNDKREVLFYDNQLGPALWRNGRAFALNRLMIGPPPGITYPRAINNKGQILVETATAGNKRALRILKYADDSNGNGLPDDWERFYWGAGVVVTSGADDDSDGLTNVQEFALRTDPRKADTDNDGWTDGWENSNGKDPLTADPSPLANSLVLSEIGPKNVRSYTNKFGQTSLDWFEVHLPAGAQVDGEGLDISNYGICYVGGGHTGQGFAESSAVWFPPGTKILPGAYLVVNASSDNIPALAPGQTDVAGQLKIRTVSTGAWTGWKELFLPSNLSKDGGVLKLVRKDPFNPSLPAAMVHEFEWQYFGDDDTLALNARMDGMELSDKATPGAANLLSVPPWPITPGTTFLPPSSIQTTSSGISILVPASPNFQYLIWTTDGSDPAVNNPGGKIARPGDTIAVNTTTVLKVRGFRNDDNASEVVSRTYIFRNDVLGQQNPPGITGENSRVSVPGSGDSADRRVPFHFDLGLAALNEQTAVGSQPAPGANATRAGLDAPGTTDYLPVVSIISDQDGLFGKERGIYSNSTKSGPDWERVAMAEFIGAGLPAGSTSCALSLAGTSGREPGLTRKHSLKLTWRRSVGKSNLNAPGLFTETTPGPTGQVYDSLVLRSPAFDSWAQNGEQRSHASYIREQWVHETIRALIASHATSGATALFPPQPRCRPVHLFLNGLYWGVYWLSEEPDEDFLKRAWNSAAHPDLDDTYFDVIEDGIVKSGDGQAWDDLQEFAFKVRECAAANDSTGAQTAYDQAVLRMDINQFIDYVLVNLFFKNEDWPEHNWVACRARPSASAVTPVAFREKFLFIPKDSEMTAGLHLSAASVTRLEQFFTNQPTNGVAALFHNLSAQNAFRTAVYARAYEFFYFGTQYFGSSTSPAKTGLTALASAVRPGILLESARWGGLPYDVPACGPTQFESEMTALEAWITSTAPGGAMAGLLTELYNYTAGGNGYDPYYTYQNPLGDKKPIAGSDGVRRGVTPTSLTTVANQLTGTSEISPGDPVKKSWVFTGSLEVHPDRGRSVRISSWDTRERMWKIILVTANDHSVTTPFSFEVLEYDSGKLGYPDHGVILVETAGYVSVTTPVDPEEGKVWMSITAQPSSPVFWVPSAQPWETVGGSHSTRLLENEEPNGTTGGIYGHLEAAFLYVPRGHDGAGDLDILNETEPLPTESEHTGYPSHNRGTGTAIKIQSIPIGGLMDESVGIVDPALDATTQINDPLRRLAHLWTYKLNPKSGGRISGTYSWIKTEMHDFGAPASAPVPAAAPWNVGKMVAGFPADRLAGVDHPVVDTGWDGVRDLARTPADPYGSTGDCDDCLWKSLRSAHRHAGYMALLRYRGRTDPGPV
jgi:hypothetical protein